MAEKRLLGSLCGLATLGMSRSDLNSEFISTLHQRNLNHIIVLGIPSYDAVWSNDGNCVEDYISIQGGSDDGIQVGVAGGGVIGLGLFLVTITIVVGVLLQEFAVFLFVLCGAWFSLG